MTPRVVGVPLALLLWACGASRAGAGEPAFSKDTHVYKTAGDCAIRADVYRPAGDERRPVLLWIHGGALIFGDRRMLPREQMLRYVGAGYVVVSIDYRLAPESKLPAILDDLEDAYRWVREKGPALYHADPDRIAVIGHSAGGYLALMAGARLRPRPRALVSFYGYGDIAAAWYSRPDPHYSSQPTVTERAAAKAVGTRCLSEGPEEIRFPFYVHCRQRGLWPLKVTGRDPDTEPAAFDPWCPVRNVGADYPPTLLLHGDKDSDVPYGQSLLMDRELERHGIAHELVTLEGRDHVFDITGEGLRDATVSTAFDRVLSFLSAHLALPLSPEAVGRIDAHAHVSADAPALYALLERLNMRMVNVCVVDRYEPGYETVEPQHAMARRLESASRGRIRWISTFDEIDWESPGFAERVIAGLDATFRAGALGVKIYKSIGMELRSRAGAYLMPDDPALSPILDAVAARGKTLYAHIAEPIAAWQPLDPASPDYDYYKSRPAWHVYGRPGCPSKTEILAARDRMLERHPTLRVVGCHLGSMEEDVDDVARRLDHYPNLVVDTAGRVPHLMLQEHDKVRAFLIAYQGRVLYATDLGIYPDQDPETAVRELEAEYARDWTFFATSGVVEYQGRRIPGLALPERVLRKLYRENVLRVVPGLLGAEAAAR
jgi:acetyl esterase/lipase/predicted TIM-barrel fold metal-dependent hydrolase